MGISSDPFTERLKIRQRAQPIQDFQSENEEIVDRFQKRSKEKYEREKEMIWDQGEDLERLQDKGTAKATSRVLESGLGTTGNIQSMIKQITGLQLGSQLPTSSELQEFSEKATRGYTSPESEFEKQGGEFLSDITQMAMPGSSSYSALRTLGIPIAGWAAKHGLESFGSDESTGSVAKMALMFALDLASAYKSKGQGGAKKYAQSLWKEAENNLPKGVSLNANKLEKNLIALETELMKGGHSPQTEKALEKISHLKSKIENGKIPADELVATRKKINDLIEANGGFDYTAHPSSRQGSIMNLNRVKDSIIGTLDEYARVNPKFGVPYKNSNEAYSAYYASNVASKFLKKYFGDYIKSPIFHGIFGSTTAKTIGAGIAGVALPYQAFKLIHRAYKSRVLRELYGNVVKASLSNDIPATAKNLEQLKKELKKEEATSKANK